MSRQSMGSDCQKWTVILIVSLYLAITILLYLSLSGTDWVLYQNGHSGFWHHCNSSVHGNATKPKNKKDTEDCQFITIQDAPDLLHVIRAFFIAGIVLWCFSLIYRRWTWRARGTNADYFFGATVIFVSSLIALAIGVNSVYHREEFVQNEKYAKAQYSYNLHLSIASCACMFGLIALTTINHMQNQEHAGDRSCSRKLNDCRCYICLTLCKRPSSSAGDSASSSARSHTMELSIDVHPNENRRRPATASQRLQISTIGWGTDSSSCPPPTSGRSRASWSGLSPTRIGPAEVIVHPPSYEEVSRSREDEPGMAAARSSTLPPTYEEATGGGRELILSPPPAYVESVS